MLRGEKEKYLRDKRMETMPKQPEPEHRHSTVPLKSVMRNSEGVKSPGGIAMHYDMQELGKSKQQEYDDRPIRPAPPHRDQDRQIHSAEKQAYRRDRRDRETQSSIGNKQRMEPQYFHTHTDLQEFSSSPLRKRNTSLKKLHNRDTQIALERREKVESARKKDKDPDSDLAQCPNPYKDVKSKVANEVKKDKRKKRSNTTNLGQSRSTGAHKTGCLKRSRSRQQTETPQQEVTSPQSNMIADEVSGKESPSSTLERAKDERHDTTRASYGANKETKDRKYYRMEDLQSRSKKSYLY